MAATDSTPKAKRLAAQPRVKAREPAPAYGLPEGPTSFRHGLQARERGVLDRALDIVGRALREREVFSTPDAVKHYLTLRLAAESREHFGVMYLDGQNRLIAFQVHFSGTLTETSVYPREVVLAALQHHAAAVVLCHNHPSGIVIPSLADKALTQTLKAALALMGIRVLDHVIVAPGAALSMAELGLI